MTGHQRGLASRELDADVDGIRCPVEACAAHTDDENTPPPPNTACTNFMTGDEMPAAHWQRVKAATRHPTG